MEPSECSITSFGLLNRLPSERRSASTMIEPSCSVRVPAIVLLTADEATLTVDGMSVGVPRVVPEYAHYSRRFVPAHHPVIRDIACLLYTSPSPRDRQKSR